MGHEMSPLNITQLLDSIRYMVYNGYYKVMSNIPKMGHLTTPDQSVGFLHPWAPRHLHRRLLQRHQPLQPPVRALLRLHSVAALLLWGQNVPQDD